MNNTFKNYCIKYEISRLKGRHPQAQGVVELYNRTIREMIKNKYIENEKNNIDFNLDDKLIIAVNIYNNTKHTTTGFSPLFLFNCKDKKIFDIVKSRTIKSQSYKRNTNNINLEDQLAA